MKPLNEQAKTLAQNIVPFSMSLLCLQVVSILLETKSDIPVAVGLAFVFSNLDEKSNLVHLILIGSFITTLCSIASNFI